MTVCPHLARKGRDEHHKASYCPMLSKQHTSFASSPSASVPQLCHLSRGQCMEGSPLWSPVYAQPSCACTRSKSGLGPHWHRQDRVTRLASHVHWVINSSQIEYPKGGYYSSQNHAAYDPTKTSSQIWLRIFSSRLYNSIKPETTFIQRALLPAGQPKLCRAGKTGLKLCKLKKIIRKIMGVEGCQWSQFIWYDQKEPMEMWVYLLIHPGSVVRMIFSLMFPGVMWCVCH